MEWIAEYKGLLGWLAGASVLTFLGTLVLVPVLVVRIPEDYFARETPGRFRWSRAHPIPGILWIALKNLLGWAFIAAGLAMLLLPGQGLVTILIGVLLIDFPGKFRVERWLAGRRPLMRAINWMRRRAGRRPMQMP